jgi:hypothetical protein
MNCSSRFRANRPLQAVRRCGILATVFIVTIVAPALDSRAAEKSAASANSAIEERLTEAERYLASDKLEGRGPGTHGIDLAADYIAAEFKKAGLKTDLYDGTPFQKFSITIGTKLGPDDRNRLEIVAPADESTNGPKRTTLKLGTDFTPLALGGSAKIDAPLVFAGYGITAKDQKYDDYAGIDVKDKAVIVLRHQPQRGNPHGLFGHGDSPFAALSRKISNAYEHGAAAIVFCNDDADLRRSHDDVRKRWQAAIDELAKANTEFKKLDHPSDEETLKQAKSADEMAARIQQLSKQLSKEDDLLLKFDFGGEDSEGREFPVLFCRREPLDRAVKVSTGKDLAAIEQEIEASQAPKSCEMPGWRIAGETNVARERTEVKNVVGVLEGEGPHADETIVIGAHYDHLGYGGSNSLARGVHAIHPGADDNASGDVALLEIARELAGREKKLPRRVVFIAFTGEERGLLGSAHYVRDPLVPLDKTVAMLNLDMVGRMQDNKLIVNSDDTSPQFDPLVDRINDKYHFAITKQPGGFGPSDHASFYEKHIPVLFFFTGTHKDYHRPSDTADKINVPDMRRVAQMVADVAVALAETNERPQFSESKAKPHALGAPGDRPYFGSVPDFGQEQPGGYAISDVTKGGPAAEAGLKGGDVIIRLGESKVGNLEDFDSALRKYHAGDKVPVVVKRGAEQLTVQVTLEPPR